MTEQERVAKELRSEVRTRKRQKLWNKGFKTMSVREMGQMLGLKKTESYYLANQHFFKIDRSQGVMRVDIVSFEEWYDNQDRYHKIGGPEPGKKLRQSSYSVKDISKMLELSEDRVLELISEKGLPTITVDYRMRVPKEVFDCWYQHQVHYRNEIDRKKDREDEARTMSIPEMARVLGVSRSRAYYILDSKKNSGKFEIIRIAGRKRITKESFARWYTEQNLSEERFERKPREKLPAGTEPSRRKADDHKTYTITELKEKCRVSRKTVSAWVRSGKFPVLKVGNTYRIPKETFDNWYMETIGDLFGKE